MFYRSQQSYFAVKCRGQIATLRHEQALSNLRMNEGPTDEGEVGIGQFVISNAVTIDPLSPAEAETVRIGPTLAPQNPPPGQRVKVTSQQLGYD